MGDFSRRSGLDLPSAARRPVVGRGSPDGRRLRLFPAAGAQSGDGVGDGVPALFHQERPAGERGQGAPRGGRGEGPGCPHPADHPGAPRALPAAAAHPPGHVSRAPACGGEIRGRLDGWRPLRLQRPLCHRELEAGRPGACGAQPALLRQRQGVHRRDQLLPHQRRHLGRAAGEAGRAGRQWRHPVQPHRLSAPARPDPRLCPHQHLAGDRLPGLQRQGRAGPARPPGAPGPGHGHRPRLHRQQAAAGRPGAGLQVRAAGNRQLCARRGRALLGGLAPGPAPGRGAPAAGPGRLQRPEPPETGAQAPQYAGPHAVHAGHPGRHEGHWRPGHPGPEREPDRLCRLSRPRLPDRRRRLDRRLQRPPDLPVSPALDHGGAELQRLQQPGL